MVLGISRVTFAASVKAQLDAVTGQEAMHLLVYMGCEELHWQWLVFVAAQAESHRTQLIYPIFEGRQSAQAATVAHPHHQRDRNANVEKERGKESQRAREPESQRYRKTHD